MYSDTGGGANFVIVKSGKPNDACCTVDTRFQALDAWTLDPDIHDPCPHLPSHPSPHPNPRLTLLRQPCRHTRPNTLHGPRRLVTTMLSQQSKQPECHESSTDTRKRDQTKPKSMKRMAPHRQSSKPTTPTTKMTSSLQKTINPSHTTLQQDL